MQPQWALPDVPDRAALEDIFNAPGSPFLDDVLLNTAWDESDFVGSPACHAGVPHGPQPSAHSTSSAHARTFSFHTLHSHAFAENCNDQPWGLTPCDADQRPRSGSSPTTKPLPRSHPHAPPQPPPPQAPSPTPMQRTSDWGGLAHHRRQGQTSEGAPKSPASGNPSADTPHQPHQHHHLHHYPATHSAMTMLPPEELPPQPKSFYPAQPLAAAWQHGRTGISAPAPAGHSGSALPPRSFAADAAPGGPPGMTSAAFAGAWSGGAGADPLCTALRSPASVSASASPAGAATPPAAAEPEALGGGAYYLHPSHAGTDPRDPGGPMAMGGAWTSPAQQDQQQQQQQGAGGWWAGGKVPGCGCRGEATEAVAANPHEPLHHDGVPPPPSSSPSRPTAAAAAEGAPSAPTAAANALQQSVLGGALHPAWPHGPGPAWTHGGPWPPASPAWASPRTQAPHGHFTAAHAYPRHPRLYHPNPYHPYARPHPHPKPFPQHAPPYGLPSAPAGLPSLPSPSHALASRRAAFGPPSPLTGAPLPYRPAQVQYGSGLPGGYGRVSDGGVFPTQLSSPRNARPLAWHLPPGSAVAGPGTPRRSAPGTATSFSSATPAAAAAAPAAAPFSTTAGGDGGGVDTPVLGGASQQLSSGVPLALPQQRQQQHHPHLVVHPAQEQEERLLQFQQHQQRELVMRQQQHQPLPRPMWHSHEAPVGGPSVASHQPPAPHCGPTPPARVPGPEVASGQDLKGTYLTSETAAMARCGATGRPYEGEGGPGRRSAPGGWPAAADGYGGGALPGVPQPGAMQQEQRRRLLAHFDSRMLEQVQQRKRILHAQLMQPSQQPPQSSGEQNQNNNILHPLLPRQQQLFRDELLPPQQQQDPYNQLVPQQQQHPYAQARQLPGPMDCTPEATSQGPNIDSPFVGLGRNTGGGDGCCCGSRASDPGTAPIPGLAPLERPAAVSLRLGQGGSFVFGGGPVGAGCLATLVPAGCEEAARGTGAGAVEAADAACVMGATDVGVHSFGGRGGGGYGGRAGGEYLYQQQQQQERQQHEALSPVLATVGSMATGGGGQAGGGLWAHTQSPRGGSQAGLAGCPATADSPFSAASALGESMRTWASEPAHFHVRDGRPAPSSVQAHYSYADHHYQQQHAAASGPTVRQ